MHRPQSVALIGAAIAATALLAGGCKDGSLGGVMTSQQERDLGAQYAADLDKHVKYVDDSKLNTRVLEIALPIFAQANKERPDVTFRIRIIDDKEVNAFSIPGGYIYVNKGLLDKIGKDDDAVACVIGHESAHVVRRHVVKQIADAQDKGLAVDVAAILTRSSVIGNIGGTIVDLQQLHFSRQDEYEADRWGERFAYNAGYDPAGMLRTFKVLEDVERTEGDHDPAYAKDHPVTRNRAIRALEQWRELRANNGQYVSDGYQPDGDQTAAKKNGISYPALVLATSVINLNNLPVDKGDTGAVSTAKNGPSKDPQGAH
jgi:predicted Zn-dependent protease